MGLVLKSWDDPRDNLEKANRDQLFDFAHENGVREITEDMPAILMRKLLRAKGIVNIKIPNVMLGAPPGATITNDAAPEKDGVQVNAEDDLERQWKEQASAPVETDPDKMTMQELRKACKARGIHMDRTDNLAKLREKLRGDQAA